MQCPSIKNLCFTAVNQTFSQNRPNTEMFKQKLEKSKMVPTSIKNQNAIKQNMTTKNRKNVCDTPSESSNIILLHDNNLGTIEVPYGTQKAQYANHIKLNTLET